MKRPSLPLTAFPLAILLLASPAGAAEPEPLRLSMEHRMLVRCSAAFAMVAHAQATGGTTADATAAATAQAYPPLAERGQEFFIRSGAQVMDEAQIDYDAFAAAMQDEARSLHESGQVDAIMPVCLQLLEQSGL